MIEVRKIMEVNQEGTHRQIYPETVPEAILGLDKFMFENKNSTVSKGYVDLQCSSVLKQAKEYANDLPKEENFTLNPATSETLGGVIVGDGLEVSEEGRVSVLPGNGALTEEQIEKINNLKEYKAGANISISDDGTISASGGGDGSGVNQEYVDQKSAESLNQAKQYVDSRITFEIEKVGEI